MVDMKQKLKQNEAIIIQAVEGYSVIIFKEKGSGAQVQRSIHEIDLVRVDANADNQQKKREYILQSKMGIPKSKPTTFPISRINEGA